MERISEKFDDTPDKVVNFYDPTPVKDFLGQVFMPNAHIQNNKSH